MFVLDHVQGDPFAAPSRTRVIVQTDIPLDVCTHPDRRLGAEDWLLRRFAAHLGGSGTRGEKRGSGRSGQMRVYEPGPEITERSAVHLRRDGVVEVRFAIGLPARGRRILGRQAYELLGADVPEVAERLIEVWGPALEAHVRSVEDQRAMRAALSQHKLVAFVANGSVLPRRSGVDPSPLPGAVPFESPASMQVTLQTPSGEVVGMGIPDGVTLIVGGGFHGKSTVLQAVQHGHLDHIAGDGRERVVARVQTVKVRAEDGRRVVGVDISAFLGDLPGGRSTCPFHTEDASGSTSQAAAIIEAVEAGAEVLLIDEDTSATNLLVRDERMRKLIPRDREPITPFVERVRALHRDWGVSTVMVVGGVGDYLAVADTVIAMTDWKPAEVTEAAHAVGGSIAEANERLPPLPSRIPLRAGLAPTGKGRIRARNDRAVDYGKTEIDLTAVEQVLDGVHAASIGRALVLLHSQLVDDSRDLVQVLDALDAILDDEGVDALSDRDYPDGWLVRPRRFEVAAAWSRLRGMAVKEAR